MVVAGTGHRPDKLGGWDNMSAWNKVVSVAEDALRRYYPDQVVSGGAAGWDLALAEASQNLGIDLVMAVPFAGQEKRWNGFWQGVYNKAMDYGEVKILTPGENLSYDVIRKSRAGIRNLEGRVTVAGHLYLDGDVAPTRLNHRVPGVGGVLPDHRRDGV